MPIDDAMASWKRIIETNVVDKVKTGVKTWNNYSKIGCVIWVQFFVLLLPFFEIGCGCGGSMTMLGIACTENFLIYLYVVGLKEFTKVS